MTGESRRGGGESGDCRAERGLMGFTSGGGDEMDEIVGVASREVECLRRWAIKVGKEEQNTRLNAADSLTLAPL